MDGGLWFHLFCLVALMGAVVAMVLLVRLGLVLQREENPPLSEVLPPENTTVASYPGL
jgi:hypothetical protein